eukprot:TRINITY_DN7820_c0_g1_i1.p2 TRINITY_DN7820_c0_g1~~TRINITY_DN7820_c0_g1_i1.p2  ORF type:complete len:258 (+),score=102.81 TRINITY_DN7820_c0_g1_i1:61-834(+)
MLRRVPVLARAATAAPLGGFENKTQSDLMAEERVLLVDAHDRIVGRSSKWDAHRWQHIRDPAYPTLHRAFSVFLFNSRDELLLQQRAAAKLTFPGVWTNTVCSHPLDRPDHVDELEGLEGQNAIVTDARGVKQAARRKLWHELALPEEELPPPDAFNFVARVLYRARMDAEWGEEELDYVLFVRCDRPVYPLNPEEVEAVRYVTLPEVRDLLADPDVEVSPWFRLIAARLLPEWWADLPRLLAPGFAGDPAHIHDWR